MQSPILKTARLTLAFPFVHEGMDVGHYVLWLNDGAVVQYSEQRHTQHSDKSQYDYLMGFPYAKDKYFWEIQLNGKPIGSITAYLDLNNKTANLGIMIGDRRKWGAGYASEAWEAVTNFLFENGYRKIEAGCMGCNLAMAAVLKKAGFTLEASIPNHFILSGQPQDKHLYGKYRAAKIIPIKKAEKTASDPT